ncbi:SDR family NAD(P)-dependent oxidoreductase [Pleomorphomonas sp. PLEO]|uniref:SDR family NAD(P)-dependent oxidoreductase n=1 Tax=Pleomorphomonas sp. PLEO TaxID=3239306 RepID=UPI00351E2013
MTDVVKRIVILGATSAMAEAAARRWAGQGAEMILVGRDVTRLEAIAKDLLVRGAAGATTVGLDCATADAVASLTGFVETLGGLDVLLLAYGALGDQAEFETDPKATADLFRTNFTSAAAWCQAGATVLERQGFGVLVVIGSVAGDRGRRSNYVYGASKAGLGVLVQGIAHRLAGSGARAVLIKPGFVDTPMTAGITRKGLLWAKPETLGAIIVASAVKGKPIVYAPAFWRFIMAIVRNVPAAIFHKTKL